MNFKRKNEHKFVLKYACTKLEKFTHTHTKSDENKNLQNELDNKKD